MILSAYYLTGSKSAKMSYKKNAVYLDKVIPDLIQLKEDGSLIIKNSDIKDGEIFPMVQNQYLSTAVTNNFLSKKIYIEKAIKSLMSFLNNSEYRGLNIDLEGVKKNTKEAYNYFIEKLSKKMKKKNYNLDISIPAKTENHIDVGWAAAYDYNYLGQLVDNIFIMAYDYHWAGGVAGPIAPISWVYNVIDYTIMEIDTNKVMIGLAGYGYDWIIDSESKRAKALSYNGVTNILKRENIRAEWDQESETPYFRYRDENGVHEVWFENKNSLFKKIELIKKFQLKGAALWRLGLEDSRFWDDI